MAEGIKHDGAKARWSLFPAGTLRKVLAVLEFGAAKYAPDNWQRVEGARERYYNALMRHIEAWWGGERTDPETGIHHLAHACCNALFLIWLDDQKIQKSPPVIPQPYHESRSQRNIP